MDREAGTMLSLRLLANLLQVPLTCGVFHLESLALLDHEADDPYAGSVAGSFFFFFPFLY